MEVFSVKHLAIIIPSVRGVKAIPTIKSALKLEGVFSVKVIVAGNSCNDEGFRKRCKKISPHVLLGKPHSQDLITPGRARNEGLKILSQNFPETQYVMFVDDDILLPEDYATVLIRFIEKEKKVVAAMGRVVSFPSCYWNQVLDYSNFWWLQVRYNITDLGWMGTGATMMLYQNIQGILFDESLKVNEDTDYFQRTSEMNKGTLGICADSTCLHSHSCCKFMDLVRYQYNNGLHSEREFHSPNISLKSVLTGLRNSLAIYKKAFNANREYLLKRPHLILGVLFSFIIYEVGILAGIHRMSRTYS